MGDFFANLDETVALETGGGPLCPQPPPLRSTESGGALSDTVSFVLLSLAARLFRMLEGNPSRQ